MLDYPQDHSSQNRRRVQGQLKEERMDKPGGQTPRDPNRETQICQWVHKFLARNDFKIYNRGTIEENVLNCRRKIFTQMARVRRTAPRRANSKRLGSRIGILGC